jgi:threonine synthase
VVVNRSDAFAGLRCTDCGERTDALGGRCPACDGALDATYDLDGVDPAALGSGTGLDRFGALLPHDVGPSAGEGETPLVPAPGLADETGVDRLLVKDEGRNPTGSFVDRGMALSVTAAAARDDPEPLALAAAGDAAQSLAAYAGRADLRSYGFVPARCPTPVKAMVNVHGGEMRVAGGRYPEAVAGLDDLASYTSLGEFATPYRHEGAKTVAHEVGAAVGGAPDAVVVPVGTGELLVGLAKGFEERVALGLADAVPDLLAVQPAGCAPVVEAHDAGAETVAPTTHPDTIAGELEIPDPAGGDLALRALDRHDGAAVAVGDPELQEGAVAATKTTGVETGLAGGAAAAGAWERAADLSGTVVVVNPNSGFKTSDVLRSHLLGQGV